MKGYIRVRTPPTTTRLEALLQERGWIRSKLQDGYPASVVHLYADITVTNSWRSHCLRGGSQRTGSLAPQHRNGDELRLCDRSVRSNKQRHHGCDSKDSPREKRSLCDSNAAQNFRYQFATEILTAQAARSFISAYAELMHS